MDDLKKQIGRLCILGFEGTQVPDWIKFLIGEWALGGVILFKRNIESKDQLAQLIAELKALSGEIPLFISVDHEGGRVFRLPPPFTQIPPAREIGRRCVGAGLASAHSEGQPQGLPLQKNDTDIAFQTGQLMGRELREVGFNLNYAPVLDVDTNPNNPIIGDRAYGSTPELVIKTALGVIRGLRSQGIIPCGKHFPGHGDTSRDSHLELPIVDHPISRLETLELVPFQAAIDDKIEMLMTAHVLYPQVDPDFPATLSGKILTGILRKKMAYEGVVISDDLLMKAISDRYGVGEAARLFLLAGGDIPLICKEEAVQKEALEYLVKSVERGELSQDRLEKSWERVSSLKTRLIS